MNVVIYCVEEYKINHSKGFQLVEKDEAHEHVIWEGDDKEFGKYICQMKEIEESLKILGDRINYPARYTFRRNLAPRWQGHVPDYNWVLKQLADTIVYVSERYGGVEAEALNWANAITMTDIDYIGYGSVYYKAPSYNLKRYCELFPL